MGAVSVLLAIIIFLLFLFLGTAINTVILRLAVSWVCKFKLPFWSGVKTVLISLVVVFICSLLFGLGQGLTALLTTGAIPAGQANSAGQLLLSILISFFVTSALYGVLIRHPEDGQVGFVRGMMIYLAQFLIILALGLVLGIIIFILALAIG
jgi:hypothetical protein